MNYDDRNGHESTPGDFRMRKYHFSEFILNIEHKKVLLVNFKDERMNVYKTIRSSLISTASLVKKYLLLIFTINICGYVCLQQLFPLPQSVHWIFLLQRVIMRCVIVPNWQGCLNNHLSTLWKAVFSFHLPFDLQIFTVNKTNRFPYTNQSILISLWKFIALNNCEFLNNSI